MRSIRPAAQSRIRWSGPPALNPASMSPSISLAATTLPLAPGRAGIGGASGFTPSRGSSDVSFDFPVHLESARRASSQRSSLSATTMTADLGVFLVGNIVEHGPALGPPEPPSFMESFRSGILPGKDVHHAGKRFGLADVDAVDHRIGIRAAQELGMQHVRRRARRCRTSPCPWQCCRKVYREGSASPLL